MTSKRMAVTAIAAAIAIAAAGAGVSAAAAGSKTHSLTFTSKQTYEKVFPHQYFTDTDKDIDHGQVIGTDIASGHVIEAKHRAVGFASFALPGGVLHSSFTIYFATGTLTGTITGGAGKYAGAHGTVKGTPTDPSGDNYRLTVNYHR